MSEMQPRIPDKAEIKQQEEALERKNRWLYPTVIGLLIFIFVVGFIYGLHTVLQMEGAFPPAVLTDSKTPVPQSEEEVVSYLQTAVSRAKEENPAFTSNCKIRIDKDSVETDGSAPLLSTITRLVEPAQDYLERNLPQTATDFGEAFGDTLVFPDFSSDDLVSFSCDYIYYKCISCGKESDSPLDSCEDCGSVYPYQMHYRDQYSFTLELELQNSYPTSMFAPSQAQLTQLFSEETAEFFTLNDLEMIPTRYYVCFSTDRATDNLLSLSYGREASVNIGTLFEGNYASLGSARVSVKITAENCYNLTWPAIVLDAHTLVLAPKETGHLNAERICSDPASYDAVWTSSDENVVHVDEEGYLKAGKNPGKAVISTSFDFQGKTYTDVCQITVQVSVKSIKLNKRHLALSVGQTFNLTATVSPADATVKTATWYSSDDGVVLVDQYGQLTAIAPGTATVYVLSDDGYYKSSCEVTVK